MTKIRRYIRKNETYIKKIILEYKDIGVIRTDRDKHGKTQYCTLDCSNFLLYWILH